MERSEYFVTASWFSAGAFPKKYQAERFVGLLIVLAEVFGHYKIYGSDTYLDISIVKVAAAGNLFRKLHCSIRKLTFGFWFTDLPRDSFKIPQNNQFSWNQK